MRLWLFLISLVLLVSACEQPQRNLNPSEDEVHAVLDDWHNAAAEADFERYFNYFHSDSSIFMGTDATERWTVPEFKAYAKPHFDKGDAWNFSPVERHLYFSDDGNTSWFDEKLDTPNLGPARGTGVLVREDTTWKIAHYNLSITIPNAIADTVVKQVEEVLPDTE